MSRVANWPDVLAAEIEAVRHKPFAWGTWDCCQFAAHVCAALTGTDYRKLFPAYANEDEATAILVELGGMQGLIEKALGPAKHVSRAMRGDVVMIEMELGWQPAICLGALSTAPGYTCLRFLPTARAEAAWSI